VSSASLRPSEDRAERLEGKRNDPRLSKIAATPDPGARAYALDELVTRSVWPKVRETAVRCIRGLPSARSESREESDRLIVESDAIAALVPRLRRAVDDPVGSAIEDVEAYVATATRSVFGQLLRSRDDDRRRVSADVRAVHKLDPRLARWIWRSLDLGGRSSWTGEGPSRDRRALQLLERPEEARRACFGSRDPASMLLPDLVLSLYAWVRGPLEINSTVGFTASALGANAPAKDALDADAAAEPAAGKGTEPDAGARARLLLTTLWEELTELTPDRRGTFLLFEPPGEHEDHLIDLLVEHRVATLTEIADFVGLSSGRLIELLKKPERITFDDVAELYGVTPKHADGVRKGIKERLARRFQSAGLYE
jgi:hypothetical protein